MYGANMAFSLKMRAPFFVHRIFELAWKVPYAAKHIDRLCKQPLRHFLYRYVPRHLVYRPNRKFGVPRRSAPSVGRGAAITRNFRTRRCLDYSARAPALRSAHGWVYNDLEPLLTLLSLQDFLVADRLQTESRSVA